MSYKLICKQCGVDFFVPKSRKDTAKFCSKACADKYPRSKNETNCTECGKRFAIKKSQVDKTVWGNFCSKSCVGEFRKRMYCGENNPNYKGRDYDNDGYRVFIPEKGRFEGKSIKLHIYQALTVLEIDSIPKGFHVHHKNCNRLDNRPENLAVMSTSDHVWLHKQFGNAGLNAHENNLISTEELSNWSDDKIRAIFLLEANLLNQKERLVNNKELTIEEAISKKPTVEWLLTKGNT